jgi:hypothetical protein
MTEKRYNLQREPNHLFIETFSEIELLVCLLEHCVNLATLTVIDTWTDMESSAGQWLHDHPVPKCTRRYSSGMTRTYRNDGFVGSSKEFWKLYDEEMLESRKRRYCVTAGLPPVTLNECPE